MKVGKIKVEFSVLLQLVQVISANADGPRNAASQSYPIDHITLHTMTEINVECIHQTTASVDIDSTLLHRPTAGSFMTHRISSAYAHDFRQKVYCRI